MSASIPTSARTVVLQNYATTEHPLDPSMSPSGTFAVKDIPLPSPLPEDALLVKTLYIPNEPGFRGFLSQDKKHEREFFKIFPLGTPFPAGIVIARIVKVGGAEEGSFKVGDTVVVMNTNWADYAVVPKTSARLKKAIPGIPISAYLGALGPSGATAYWALKAVLKPKESDTLVVSGAAGAVGNVAVQYAKKVLGVKRVVGIAGTDKKCSWLKSIGADDAVNYKSATFVEDLAKATPEKVDVFFDNVGGSILDEVLMRMKPHGVICIVGAMAQMTNTSIDEPLILKNFAQILTNRLSLSGMTLLDYMDKITEVEEALERAVTSGKLVVEGAETVVDIHGDIGEIPRVWSGLFTGVNTGKLITKVAD